MERQHGSMSAHHLASAPPTCDVQAPLVRGWNLFELRDTSVNYLLLTSSQISIVQVAAIVVGHVVAVVAAHDRAVRLLKTSDGVRGQYALMTVMVSYTAAGVALLAGS